MNKRGKGLAIFKRPFETRYYSDPGAKEDAYATQGFSNTWERATSTAMWRCFLSQYAMARVYDRQTGAVVHTIKRGPHGWQAYEGNDVPRRIQTQLRRVS